MSRKPNECTISHDVLQSTFRPPPYLEIPLLPLHRPVSLNLDSTDNDGQEALPEADMTRLVSIYGHSRVYDNSLEDLFASNESLPPFPADPVTEIVDLIRMAASLLYKEMQLVLISETQSGRFPTSRGDTWLRLGQLHRLISSWPDGTLSATEGIKSFGRSLNDGTILCEYVVVLICTSLIVLIAWKILQPSFSYAHRLSLLRTRQIGLGFELAEIHCDLRVV